MTLVDGVGAVGEVISWVGLIVGLPLLVLSLAIRAVRPAVTSTPLVLIEDPDGAPVALWTVGTTTHSRGLSDAEARELSAADAPVGYVSEWVPERMHVDARLPVERACATVAFVMLGAAALGFLASLAPLIFG